MGVVQGPVQALVWCNLFSLLGLCLIRSYLLQELERLEVQESSQALDVEDLESVLLILGLDL